MFNDWWVAHRLEVYVSLVMLAVFVPVALVVWWTQRRKR